MRRFFRQWLDYKLFIVLGLLVISSIGVGMLAGETSAATNCSDQGFGTVSMNSNLVVGSADGGNYKIWSRMQGPTASSTYLLKVGSNCYLIGGSGISSSAWTWTDRLDGASTTVNLQPGSYPVTMYGTAENVLLDRIIFTKSTAGECAPPTGTGDACVSVSNNAAPSVSLTAPTANAQYNIGDSITISANASDSDGSISKVEFYVNGVLKNTDTSSAYSYALTTLGLSAGNYTISAKAYDNTNASTTSTAVTVTLKVVTAQKPGDCNSDGLVNSTDLAIFSFNYGKTGVTFAQGDFTGDGVVNSADVAVLSFGWGK